MTWTDARIAQLGTPCLWIFGFFAPESGPCEVGLFSTAENYRFIGHRHKSMVRQRPIGKSFATAS